MSSVHFHMSAGNQEYRIKEIIKIELAWLSNRNEPELYFKLKWSDDSTSYEPKSNLTNCNEAINEYIEKLIEEGYAYKCFCTKEDFVNLILKYI